MKTAQITRPHKFFPRKHPASVHGNRGIEAATHVLDGKPREEPAGTQVEIVTLDDYRFSYNEEVYLCKSAYGYGYVPFNHLSTMGQGGES